MTQDNPETVELRDYLRILWHRRILIALACVVAAAAVFAYSSQRTRVYVAVAKVFIGPRSVDRGDASGALQELAFSKEFVASYAEQLRSRPLVERVVDKTSLRLPPTSLVRQIRTRIIPNTRIIEVSVSDRQAARAALVANSLVETFVGDLQRDGEGSARASVFESALTPREPVSPRPLRDGMMGGFLGLAVGVAAALFIEHLDTTMRTRQDAEKALSPLPVLATIPRSTSEDGRRLHLESDMSSATAEAFRILRTNVQFLSVDRPIATVLVGSPQPEDGKTTVAANLAASMAAAGYRTLFLEADLRRPAAHELFRLPGAPGLSDVLVGRCELAKAIRQTSIPRLLAITAGTPPPNPAELLGSRKMKSLLKEIAGAAELVIVDTPPALPLADAAVLGPHVDGVILVVRVGRTPRQRARDAKSIFERLGVRVLGTVLNDLTEASDGYYYYYSYAGRGNGRGSSPPRSPATTDETAWDTREQSAQEQSEPAP